MPALRELPSLSSKFLAFTVILPPPPALTLILEELAKETVSVALIVTLPPLPCPKVLASNRAPLVRVKEPVFSSILPALPIALELTLASIEVKVSGLPFKDTVSVALTVILPALPCPDVFAIINAPLLRVREGVVIVISPPLPIALAPILDAIALVFP